MAKTTTIEVPDIGDFKDVEVIEVLISPGDRIEIDSPLITLESDKATMEVPSRHTGLVKALKVAIGDKVSMGSPIVEIAFETSAEMPGEDPGLENTATTKASGSTAGEIKDTAFGDINADIRTDVVVLGAGPGGYTAAFRAADLGKNTVLVERYPALGGVCLNVGCIPSKAYLHTAGILNETREMAARGVVFGEAKIDLPKLVAWKNRLVNRLAKGIAGLAKQRKVRVLQGIGTFVSPNLLRVQSEEESVTVAFEHAIIAVGSRAVEISAMGITPKTTDAPKDDPRLWNSSDALNPKTIPERLLVMGGGIIGLEMATLYNALGARITVVELQDSLIPGCDPDLVRPLKKRIDKQYENIFLSTRVTGIESRTEGLKVSFSGQGIDQAAGQGTGKNNAPESDIFDAVLVAVGRSPAGGQIAAEKAGVHVDERGFIPVDKKQRTNVPHIFAIGDVAGQPMLAHKAVHQGKVAAEAIANLPAQFDARAIPSVAYTDPEVAWMGLTETEAKEKGIEIEKGAFPWAASGRALGIGREEG
ncbi:MAG: dihydrolipoyl dehydrogenase, partial [Gammaproteobacteria bacterium]|nr:dihydrolipoyl dehydrogenase [Gammaproteobacteria bacterium]